MFYALKDWFIALCSLIVMMGFNERPDVPYKVAGIPGLNPWNILMMIALFTFFVQKRKERNTFDMPPAFLFLIGIYFLIVIISFFRLLSDRNNILIAWMPLSKLISEYIINTFKFVIPGFLIFYGCRSRKRVKLVLVSILLMGLILAAQIGRKIPSGYAFSGSHAHRRDKLDREVGWHAVDLSTIMAGTAWATLATVGLFHKRRHKALLLLIALFVFYAQALTGGRGGYLACGATGFMLCLLKWRKYLVLAPVILILLPIVLPGPTARMLEGFGTQDISGGETMDTYKITSGRWLIWPYVIDKIYESPMFGYGRLAMRRTDLSYQLMSELGESFPHPHNAYLEWLLDNGLVGFLPMMIFYLVVFIYSTKLFLSKTDPLYSTIGGVTLALVLSQLTGAMGAQSFYPREGTMIMWCAIGLTLRVTVDRLKVTSSYFRQNYQYNSLPAISQATWYPNPQ
jgi:O-antigen ligase